MQSNDIIPIVCGLTSFLFVAISLVIDFFDEDRGTVYRKGMYLFGMLYNTSLLLRFQICDATLLFWYMITAIMFVEKVAHYKHAEKMIDASFNALRKLVRLTHTY